MKFRKENVEAKRIVELESELEYTKKALDLTKSSLRFEAEKVDSLEAQLRGVGSASTASPVDSIIQSTAEIESKIAQYEQKIEQLSTLLNEEEASHRDLVTQLESKIDELQQATVQSKSPPTPSETMSPTPVIVVPVSKTKVKVLEQRIVEMTISLDEKDKRIFELETEIDSVKVELNQVRVEAARVPELEATIHAYESRGCEEDSSLPPLPIEDLNTQDRMKGLEQRVDELVQLVEYLKADKVQLEAERDRLVQTEAEPRVEDPEISELRKRISELEEAIEISEMNRKLLRENFTKENEEKLSLIVELERLRAYVPTVETPGGALVTVEDASKLMKVQQVQIETLTLEVNTLRILPSKNVDSGETTTPDEFVRPRPSPTGCGVGGCFGWSSRRSRA